MWIKAIILDNVTYIKRDFRFWISIGLIWIGGLLVGLGINLK